ncbi:FANCC protein, partial [Emberiza fucata]|nr:FANCC protein [Emberiza fucata]
MAQDTTVPKLNFEYWSDKAFQWGQATTLELQKDVCLHLPQLQEFLHQLHETIKHLGPIVAIQQFPLIGQLLGRLCWNPFVIGCDESQKTLMGCLCCLYSSEPQNAVELKANSWVRSLLCHLLSSSEWESNEAETSTFISALGFTSADYYCHLVKNVSICISASRVNAVSIFCVPLITLPDLAPLLETLLLYHGGSSKEILSSEFLEAVNEAFLKKKISRPESAVFSLWLRHLPSLEKATLHLLDQLFSIQLNSLEEVARVIKDSLLVRATCSAFDTALSCFKKYVSIETCAALEIQSSLPTNEERSNQNTSTEPGAQTSRGPCLVPGVPRLLRRDWGAAPLWSRRQLKMLNNERYLILSVLFSSSLTDLFEIWFLVACFGEWVDIAAEQLLKAVVEPDPVLWLLAFYYCPKNENQQRTQTMVEAQEVYNHLMMLSSCRDLSLKDLEAAVHRITGVEQCCNQQLTTHLLTNFLLFSPGGHKIAQECIYHITEISDTSKEVYNLLIRTAYRFNHSGEENQRTVELMNELLQKLTLKV